MKSPERLCLAGICAAVAYPALAGQPMGIGDLDQVVLEKLKLQDFSLVDLDLPQQQGHKPFSTKVLVDGQEWNLVLNPYSVRGEGFQLRLSDETGTQTIDAPPPATYRGQVIEMPGATVAASIIDGQMHAMIFPEDREEPIQAIEPVSRFIPNAPADAHILYSTEDIGDIGTCGVAGDGLPKLPRFGGQDSEGVFLRIADLAIDCDAQFYNNEAGSSATTALALVEQVINGVRFIYERDVTVTFDLSTVIVRTEDIVYTGTASGCQEAGLLQQLTEEWQTNQSGIPHDVAHLFSGRNFDGGIIGCAWLNAVCEDQPYGVNQATFSLATNTGLVAHEIGHNFSAVHCDNFANPCFIMCSFIGGCDGDLTKFGVDSINSIDSWADGADCLDLFSGTPTADCQLSAFDWVLADSADGTGTINVEEGSCFLAITGGDAGLAGETEWLADACVDATVSAWYSFTSDDTGDFDSIYYTVDGDRTTIANNNSQGIHVVTFEVDAGDEFGFGAETSDGIFGGVNGSVFFFAARAPVAQPTPGWGGGSDSGGSALQTGGCIDIVGGDSSVPGVTELNTFACYDGQVTAETNYTSSDTGDFDSAYYNVGGDLTTFADNSSQGDDTVSFFVDADELFGFGVETADGIFGPGVLTAREIFFNAGPQRIAEIPFSFDDTAGGSGFQSSDFSSLTITGGDDGFAGETTYTAAVSCSDLIVKARVDYSSTDTGTFDSAFYFVDDEVVTVAANDSQGIFDVEFLVPRSDSFGFGVQTIDGAFGPGSAFISNIRMFPVGSSPCVPDFNNDGSLNIFDFVAYQEAFNDGRKCADVNTDGSLNVFDFVAYQEAFSEGCD